MTDATAKGVTTPEITVVCPDVSTNALGRSMVLAQVIALHHHVRIVGLQRGDELWPPAQGMGISVTRRRIRNVVEYPAAMRWLRQQLIGQRVVVSKPVLTSLGLTRWAGVGSRHLLLDNDDWELGFRQARAKARPLDWVWDQADVTNLNGHASTWLLEQRLSRFPFRTVSNAWLQKRFGGEVLPHVRDLRALDPHRIDVAQLKAEWGMDNRPWVGFVGTPRPHKGLDTLLSALGRWPASSNSPGLYLAGVDPGSAYGAEITKKARRLLGSARLCVRGPFPFEELALHVAAADIICVPSGDNPGAIGQLPAKLVDGMAMGKPVVASAHNDMAKLLDGCGEVVRPGDVPELRAAIERLADDEVLRRTYGRRARERALGSLSLEAGWRTLEPLLAELRPFGMRPQ